MTPVGLTVKADELGRLAVDLGNRAVGIDSRVALVVRKAGLDVERYAKQYAAVDTGFMRSSIHTSFRAEGFRLYEAETIADAYYSAFVEDGTSRMAPQPFMRPALDRVEPGFIAALEAIADLDNLP